MKDIKERLSESMEINEGCYTPSKRMDKNKCWEYWEQAQEIMGAEKMLSEIFQNLDDNTCSWIIEELNKDYELDIL